MEQTKVTLSQNVLLIKHNYLTEKIENSSSKNWREVRNKYFYYIFCQENSFVEKTALLNSLKKSRYITQFTQHKIEIQSPTKLARYVTSVSKMAANMTRRVVFRKGPKIYEREQNYLQHPNWFAKYIHKLTVCKSIQFHIKIKTHWIERNRNPLNNCSMANLQFECAIPPRSNKRTPFEELLWIKARKWNQ